MAISITHAFVSGKADPPDASLIKPSNWNAPHTLSMGTGKLVGRTTASTGAAEEISVAGALTFSALTLSLPVNAIGNTYLADMATQTIKGRTTAATGDPEDLTTTQVTAMLNTFTTSLKGLAPASGGGTTNFLRADGTWAAPPSANAQSILDSVDSTRGTILYRGSGAWAGLDPSTVGYVLRDGGSGADPSWGAGVVLGTYTTASSTSVDFTGIPSWARRIVISLVGVSTNGTSSVGIQLGDSGGVETSGYLSGIFDDSSTANATTGFFDNSANSAIVRHGQFHLTLADPATNTWTCIFILGYSNAASGRAGGGSKATSATLDRVRLTTSGGTDTFDAGSVNIAYW